MNERKSIQTNVLQSGPTLEPLHVRCLAALLASHSVGLHGHGKPAAGRAGPFIATDWNILLIVHDGQSLISSDSRRVSRLASQIL